MKLHFKLLFLLFILNCFARGISSISFFDKFKNKAYFEEDFCGIINRFGYPCEEHFVTTEDGYILGVFRIPHGRGDSGVNAKPILLQHGLLDSSFTWIVNQPDESLSYILADAGYDVWMGNNRGNIYSTNHTSLSNTSREFWEFSYDQMGLYDLPAMVDYILDQTDTESIPYVGHSEGTMQAFIAYLKIPNFSNKVPLFFALGPVGNVTNITNKGLRGLADLHIDTLLSIFGMNRFLPSPVVLRGLFVDFCIECETCCADVVEWICGPHKGAFNDSVMPSVSGHEPSGTSLQNIQHFAQGVQLGQFQMFDYGSILNLERYNSTRPPIYDISLFPSNVKVSLYSGTLDELADPIDVKQLVSLLPKESILQWTVLDDYAHLDYVWATDAHQLIYNYIIQDLESFERSISKQTLV